MREELAGCLIIENERVLLVKEAKDWYWKIPSGKVDGNESLEETARRETEEETGLEVELKGKFNSYDFEFKGRDFRLHVYRARIIKGNLQPKRGDSINEVKWLPIESLNQSNTTPSNKLIYQELK